MTVMQQRSRSKAINKQKDKEKKNFFIFPFSFVLRSSRTTKKKTQNMPSPLFFTFRTLRTLSLVTAVPIMMGGIAFGSAAVAFATYGVCETFSLLHSSLFFVDVSTFDLFAVD